MNGKTLPPPVLFSPSPEPFFLLSAVVEEAEEQVQPQLLT
jgi:hypothetical protein